MYLCLCCYVFEETGLSSFVGSLFVYLCFLLGSFVGEGTNLNEKCTFKDAQFPIIQFQGTLNDYVAFSINFFLFVVDIRGF